VDGIPPALLTGGGLTGVLTFLIIAFVKGWLYTSSVVDRFLHERDETIAFQRKTIEALTAATQEFAVTAHTSAYAIHAIELQAQRNASKGGDDS
jgi:hypothetical protein